MTFARFALLLSTLVGSLAGSFARTAHADPDTPVMTRLSPTLRVPRLALPSVKSVEWGHERVTCRLEHGAEGPRLACTSRAHPTVIVHWPSEPSTRPAQAHAPGPTVKGSTKVTEQG